MTGPTVGDILDTVHDYLARPLPAEKRAKLDAATRLMLDELEGSGHGSLKIVNILAGRTKFGGIKDDMIPTKKVFAGPNDWTFTVNYLNPS